MAYQLMVQLVGPGGRVSGAVRVVVDCGGTRGLSLVGATDCSAIIYRLKT